MMFVELSSRHLNHDVPDLDWDVHLAEKALETVSRTSICTRSGKNSNEYISLLFCTEKIVFCNKLSKRYRVKTRKKTSLELRER